MRLAPLPRRAGRASCLALALLAASACVAAAPAPPPRAAAEATAPAVRIAPDDPASVQKGIDAACKAGARKVLIPPGTYRLPQGEGRFYLRLVDVSDLEIDARGVTFVRTDPTKGGIEFWRCRNVTLRGATLVNETPPFTQGTIEAIDAAGEWYDVRIDRGYPAGFDDPRYFVPQPVGYVFDPKGRQWKAETFDLSATRVERLGPDRFRLHWGRRIVQPAAAGDLMAFRGKGNTDIRVGDCAGMNITDVTILSGGGFCIHEDGGEGGSRFSYKVTYGPKPAGATASPLIACNADAFHSSGVRRGPTVENCFFEGMPDDGVPIHGSYSLVVQANESALVATDGRFRPGDPLRLLTPEGGLAGEAVVRAVRPLKDFQPPQARSRHRGFQDLARRRFSELVLDRPLAAAFDYLVSNPAAIGSGYVVRNNTIRNHRARGMLLKADNGLVEGNTIDGSTIAGIVLAPELWWGEACYSRSVILRHNTIRHTGYATVGPWTDQAGAMTLAGAGGKADVADGHRHIVIENNTFIDCSGANLLIASAKDVAVKGNRFIRPMREPSRRGADRGVDPGALVALSACDDVRFEGNTVTEAGPEMKRLFATTPTATNVKGLEGGLRK